MDERSESEQAAVFDFVCLFLEDSDREARQPLTEYLRRFPGHQDAVASEYLRLVQEEREPEDVVDLDEGPQRVGPYRLIRQLGAGGQGAVFLAEDTRIQRKVALKLLHGGFVTQDRRARLKREAESIASLAHPGICAVLEAEVEGDAPYIAMQFLDGVDLGNALEMAREDQGLTKPALIPKTRVELVSVLQFFERTARALHAAHEAGVVHRDIKPGNIFVGESGRPVILDFGLARDEVHEDVALTRSGEVFGTPAYMSPEQLMGKRASITGRTDVFSLGVTLYEALLGHRPFQGASRFALEKAILYEPPPDPRSKNPILTEDVKVVLETALEKDPARRYESALAFAEDLRRIRVYEPVQARPASVGLRLRRWVRREPALATAIVGVFLLLTVSLSIALTLLSDTKDALRLAKGNLLTKRVEEVNEVSPAAGLALGLEVLGMAPGPRARTALYGPLEDSRLLRIYELDDLKSAVQILSLTKVGTRTWVTYSDGWLRVFEGEATRAIASWSVFEQVDVVLEKQQAFPVAVAPTLEVTVCGGAGGNLVAYANSANLASGSPALWTVDVGVLGISWIEFSPDGAWCVVQEQHGETLIVRAADGHVLRRFANADDGHTLARVSPDGRTVVTSGAFIPPRIHAEAAEAPALWNTSTGARIANLAGHTKPITWTVFGGDLVATASEDGHVRLFDATTGQPDGRSPLGVGTEALCHVDMNASGTRIAFCSREGAGLVWNANLMDGSSQRLVGHEGPVFSATFSPDGERLATCALDGTVRLWNATDGHLQATLRGYVNPLRAVWSPLGNEVVVRDLRTLVYVFDSRTPPLAYRLSTSGSALTWCSFLPDGLRAVIGDDAGGLTLFATPPGLVAAEDAAPGSVLARFEGLTGPVVSGRVSRDGTQLLAWSASAALIWDLESGDLLQQPRPHAAGLVDADLAPQGDAFVTVDGQGVVRLWRADGPELVLDAPKAKSARYSSNGSRIVVACRTSRLEVFAATDGAHRSSIELPPVFREGDPPKSLLLEAWPDAERVSVLTNEEPKGGRMRSSFYVHTVDLETEQVIGEHYKTIDARWMRLVRGGAVAVAGDRQGGNFARVHHPQATEGVTPATRADQSLSFLDVDPSGRFAVTSTSAGRAIVWDLKDGSTFTIYDRHGPAEVQAVFDPVAVEPRILSISADGSAAIWPVDPLPAVESRMGRPLYDWERRQYLQED